MTDAPSAQFLQLVQGGRVPRFVYSVADDAHSARVVLAGAAFFDADAARQIARAAIASVISDADAPSQFEVDIAVAGTERFALRRAHPSWVTRLIPPARDGDYMQIVPLSQPTIDVPSMDLEYGVDRAGAWKWLSETWGYDAPDSSKVATNLAALRGEPITEASRWEDDYFEAFAGSGPGTPSDEVRFVGFPPLVGADPTLAAVASMPVGESLRRRSLDDPWQPWSAHS